MFQQYRAFACLTMACFGTLLVCASPAIAVRGERSTPETLWKAFPLNPTGERLVKTDRPFVPPTTEALEEFVPASDSDTRHIVRPILLVSLYAALIALIALVPLLGRSLRRSRFRPKANEGGSHDRLLGLSFIGAIVAAEVLYGYGIYSIVVLVL